MIKFKKTLGIALAASMVASMSVGCTNTKDTKETTTAEEAKTTETEAETTKAEKENDAAEAGKTTEAESTEAETTEEETTKAPSGNGGELVFDGYTPEVEGAMELLAQIEELKSYYATTELTFDVNNSYDDYEESYSGAFTADSALNADGESSVSLSGNVSADGITIEGQFLNASYVDGVSYLDIRDAYNIAEKLITEEYMEQMATGLGTDLDSLKKLLFISVPVEGTDLAMPAEAKDAYEKLSGMVSNDVALAVSAGDFLTEDDGIYSMVINNDNFGEFLYDLLSALDTNIDEIYDTYVEYMEAVNLPEMLNKLSTNYIDELIGYVEKITGQTVTDEQKAEFEAEFKEEIETYVEEYEEMIQNMKDSKADFMSEWDDLIAEMRAEGYEGVKEGLEESGLTIDATVNVGEKNGSYVLSGDIKVDENTDYYKMSTAFTVKSVVEPEDDITITAPQGATPFEEALDVVADVYKAYYEQMNSYVERSREAQAEQESLDAQIQAELESAQQDANN
ncbi:MAG: hypothetical protein K6F92_04730 [Lachnospiraceae bacterium]|nr:hypothetical protein [Lachnospiraceae bacterium]